MKVVLYVQGEPVRLSDPFGLCPFPLSSCLGREGADLAAGFVPALSMFHDGATVLTGRNLIADESVGAGGHFIVFIGMASPASGPQVRAAGELVNDFLTSCEAWKGVGSFIEEAMNTGPGNRARRR